MLKITLIHFIILFLAGVAFAQQVSSVCKCNSLFYWKTYTFTITYTGTSTCSVKGVKPTCTAATTTSHKLSSVSAGKTSSSLPSLTVTPVVGAVASSTLKTTTYSSSSSSSRSSSSSTSLATTSKPSSSSSSSSIPVSTTPKPLTTSSATPSGSSTSSPSKSSAPSSSSSTPTSTTPKPSTTPSTTQSSTSSPSSTPSTSCVPTPNNGKRGVAYNLTPLTNLFSCASSKSSWSYNWYSSLATDGRAASYNKALMFIPMLWSDAQDLTSVWNANANAAISNGATALMSFNEPDGCGDGGSCMNVSTVVQGYKKWMQPFSSKAKLIAPAVTNGYAPAGLTYLQNFISACNGCTIDYINIHWYGDAGQISDFKNYIQQAYTAGGNRPIWITEFGCTSGTDASVQAFMKAVLPWLDQQAFVAKYSFYMAHPQNTDPSVPFLFKETLVSSSGTALSGTGVIFDQL